MLPQLSHRANQSQVHGEPHRETRREKGEQTQHHQAKTRHQKDKTKASVKSRCRASSMWTNKTLISNTNNAQKPIPPKSKAHANHRKSSQTIKGSKNQSKKQKHKNRNNRCLKETHPTGHAASENVQYDVQGGDATPFTSRRSSKRYWFVEKKLSQGKARRVKSPKKKKKTQNTEWQ